MAQVKDPVCGMMVDSVTATEKSIFEEQVYFFCSPECKDRFDSNPAAYLEGSQSASTEREVPVEKHEPPFTKLGGIVSPKFGSAGSGGAEYEPLPEQHDKT